VAETRAAILSAVRELFDEQGYVETTIDDIAARADIAPRTFFRYFPTKEAALFAGADDVRLAILAAIAARPLDEPPLRSLLRALDEVAATVEPLRDELVWAFRILHQNPEAGIDPATVKARSLAEVATLLAGRMGVDVDVDPRPTAWVGAALALFGAAMRTMSTSDRPVRDVYRELVVGSAAGVAATAEEWSRTAGGTAGSGSVPE
jgi:AcrR family transcriptional regulator